MTDLNAATDAIINRAKDAAANASPEDLVYLAKSLEGVGPASAVQFINATSEAQNGRLLATGDEQDARVKQEGDTQVSRVQQVMGQAVGTLSAKGDLLVHDGQGAARIAAGVKGQTMTMGADGMPAWGPGGKVRNVAHYAFWDVTRATWSGYGNILSGSEFLYKPLRDDSKLMVMAELAMSSCGNWSGANIVWIPVNATGTATESSWRYGPGVAGERYNGSDPANPFGFDPWSAFGGYYSQFGNTYTSEGWNNIPRFSTTMMVDLRKVAAFDASQGHKIKFAMTCHAQGSWFAINENYNQSNLPARYSHSGYVVWELAPTANTDQE